MPQKTYVPKQDAITPYQDGKTIYDVNNWTIIRKNFIAGIGRSAGSWFFNIVIIGILAYILIPILGNKFQELSNNFNQISTEVLERVQIDFQELESLTKHN